MKKIYYFLLLLASFGTLTANAQQLTQQERDYATKLLNETHAEVFNAIKGLSEAQLKFKASPDKWSVEECVKHIAAAETHLWKMADSALKLAPNPEKRAGIPFTDEQLVAAVKDRTKKSKTFAALEPASSPYTTLKQALEAFTTKRKALITYITNTKDNMRSHVLVLPMGTFDSYHFVLLIAAHTDRHVQQIEEVKANPNFPKQ
ncbi:MAG: DinB family protein [Pedobacter sp.]|nr:DinB family protein [Pedobacter sp.]MDQ8053854.1 DinB family protein [Pedobacter sp.]